jgi:hypothetical protein
MNKDNNCRVCGGGKVVVVATIHSEILLFPPGVTAYLPEATVERVDCACSECGLLYILGSLTTPVEFYE